MNGQQDNVAPITSAGQVRGGGNGGNGKAYELHGRVSAIETELKHLATKNDISNLKVWMLAGVLGGIFGGIGIVVSIALLITRLASVIPN